MLQKTDHDPERNIQKAAYDVRIFPAPNEGKALAKIYKLLRMKLWGRDFLSNQWIHRRKQIVLQ